MKKTYGLGVLSATALSLVWACSSSSSPTGNLGGGDSGSLPDTSVDDGSGDDGNDLTDSAAGGDAGHDAAGNRDGGGGSDSGLDAPSDATPPQNTQCPTGHAWTAGALQVADSIARFGGMAPTGLTAAWTRPSGDGVAGDRPTAASSFMTLEFLLPGLPTGVRPALDSTGTLVFGVGGALGLDPQIWQRTDPQSPWQLSSAPTTPFDAIIGAVSQSGWTWSEPAFGASGDRLFYIVDRGQPYVYESQWDAQSASWTAGVQLPNPEFMGPSPSVRRRPTGASSDDRTLFFFDEVSGVERAAWRTDPSQPFSYFEDIPAAPEAAPNLDCSALYFIGGGPLPETIDSGSSQGDDAGHISGPPSDAGPDTGTSNLDAGSVWNGSGTGIFIAQ